MAKDTFLNRNPTPTLKLGTGLLDLSKAAVMGIINITPDSFFEASRHTELDAVLKKTEHFLKEGAKFIDIGGYSSRPGARNITGDEELQRVVPVIEAISKNFPEAFLSVDTFRAKVARYSVQAGAHLINDISGGELDPEMFPTVAELNVPYVLMHMKGTPQNMQDAPSYENITLEVTDYFQKKVHQLREMGVKDLILDPGFGFSKNLEHNYKLLQEMEDLHIFELPLLVGFSRKSMIYKSLNSSPDQSLNGSSVLNTIALLKGAKILRVHDVKEAVECITLIEKMQSA
ncbi:dihydropteroate synthase [Pedobacter nutrimenti]|jgi:dihydropteroate synthase|uniref:dihydropteroate synthase n=1 Tax=Pedobacter nutrimenti TaxID=1241337 RepID=A0A318UBV1_9SPHI|nr:dihydropteroate synthase [Pedobacter nutrimenti]PYF69960.1 dihydropteroate synthase [Pedobacter nutrimenti]